MVGYVDARYMSDPHNARSQTDFVFLYGGAAVSWRCEADLGCHIDQPLKDNRPVRSHMRVCLATTND
jgi:hypothetical protein